MDKASPRIPASTGSPLRKGLVDGNWGLIGDHKGLLGGSSSDLIGGPEQGAPNAS